jgi:hypothetical protein
MLKNLSYAVQRRIQDSIIGAVTELWSGRSGVRIPTQARQIFSSLKRPDRFWGHPDYHPMSTGVIGGGKAAGA